MRVFCAPRFPVLAALFTALFPAGALACSCMFSSTPEAFVSEVSVIINGTLEKTEPCADGSEACVVGTFRVNEIFKGPSVTTMRISYNGGDGASCGHGFPVGKAQLIAAYGDVDSGFETGSCTQYPLDRGGADNPHILAAMRYRERVSVFDRALLKSSDDTALLLRKTAFLTKNRDVDRGLEAVEQLLAQAPDLDEADLSKAILRNAELGNGLWRRVDLSGADLEGARGSPQISESKLDGLWAPWANLPGSWFHYSARGAVFAGSNLQAASLVGVDLSDADFSNANLSGANLDGANLTGANLRKADLRMATLRFANLEDADLIDTTYDQATVWPDGFDPMAAGARKTAN